MRVLGLDLGVKTLGVAISDRTNTIATPLKVLHFPREDYESILDEIFKIIEDNQITDIALGLPKNMDNTLGFAAKRSLRFAQLLERFSVNIHLIDERLTTVSALNTLKEMGVKKINQKNIVDKMAASIILESYLKGIENEK